MSPSLTAACASLALGVLVPGVLAVVVVARRRRRAAARVVAVDDPDDANDPACDRAAFRALRGVGADPTRPTEMSYYLYFADLRSAQSAAAQVAALRVESPRLAVRVERAPLGTSWLCLVTMHAEPSERTIRAACEQLRAVAEERGGELDGWEVAVTW